MGWSVSLRIGGVLVELVYEADAQMSQSLRRHPPEYPGGSEESPHDPPPLCFGWNQKTGRGHEKNCHISWERFK